MIFIRSLQNTFITYILASLFLVPATLVQARRTLSASSLVSCMQNSQLVAKSFDVYFDPDSSALHYSLDINTEISGEITAYVDVYAYGFKIISRTIDVCDIGWKQFCPISPGTINVESIQYISEEYTKLIPGIAYQVPDIDAVARLKIVKSDDLDGQVLACIQAYFTNGKTVAQTGVKWATAVVAGIGLLISALLAAFGNSVAATHIGANAMSLFLYFQNVAIISMLHVEYLPPIASSWAENLVWSMGLIRISFMQKIFRWYVEATGGTPALFLTSTTYSVLPQKLRKRALDYIKPLVKRAKQPVLYGNSNVKIFRGMKRVGYRMNIENTSIVPTGFTFFILCGYLLAAIIIASKFLIELFIKWGWVKNSRLISFRKSWTAVIKGALLKYFCIGFTQVAILGMWEFFERDSPAVIVLAVIYIIVILGLMIWSAYRTWYFGRQSTLAYQNPAALLYGDDRVLTKFGWFYSMFNAQYYWWGGIVLLYSFVKALFVALAQNSGMTQALAIFIVELIYFGALIYFEPYLDKRTNVLNILIQTVNLINSFLFMFFSDLFGQPAAVASIMAWVFFILNAAFSLILLLMVLVYTGIVLWKYKNPDVNFKPARDDRFSFQKGDSYVGALDDKVAKELLSLGTAVKQHDTNWEDQLQEQKQVMQNEEYNASTQMFQTKANGSYADLLGESSSSTDTNEKVENSASSATNEAHPGLKSRLKSFTAKLKRNPTMDSTASFTSLSKRPTNDPTPEMYISPSQIPSDKSHERTASESKTGLMNSAHSADNLTDSLKYPQTLNREASSDSFYNQEAQGTADVVNRL